MSGHICSALEHASVRHSVHSFHTGVNAARAQHRSRARRHLHTRHPRASPRSRGALQLSEDRRARLPATTTTTMMTATTTTTTAMMTTAAAAATTRTRAWQAWQRTTAQAQSEGQPVRHHHVQSPTPVAHHHPDQEARCISRTIRWARTAHRPNPARDGRAVRPGDRGDGGH